MKQSQCKYCQVTAPFSVKSLRHWNLPLYLNFWDPNIENLPSILVLPLLEQAPLDNRDRNSPHSLLINYTVHSEVKICVYLKEY